MRSGSQARMGTSSVLVGKKRTVCPRDEDCGCFSGVKAPSTNHHDNTKALLHMDECDDPDCIDYEQLKELQQTYEQYTDYDHYERCCDRHMHRRVAQDCCSDDGNDCCDLPAIDDECVDCIEDCDECVEEHEQAHANCLETPSDISMPLGCEDDCTQCEVDCEENGHDRRDCPQDHHTSWDSCISTCGVCVDSIPLATLGPSVEVELYGLNSLMPHLTPCNDTCSLPVQMPPNPIGQIIGEPVFDPGFDHWQTFQRAHHCAPDPCLIGQLPQFPPPQHVEPNFGFTFGCDPLMPGNQYPWQRYSIPNCNVQAFEGLGLNGNLPVDMPQPQVNETQDRSDSIETSSLSLTATTSNSSDSKSQSPVTTSHSVKLDKSCQWLMPCGNVCGAKFSRTEDLKKHVKNSHQSIKGTVTCRWNGCTATFATDAALTGHISKKHIAPLAAAAAEAGDVAEEGAWKCTVPGCGKSFMYKQVRDDHVASHSGGNRTHCPICHQWLNNEGSNFRRHMASHRPENEHMRCKHQHLGCRRKFPRLDNLRRHEACCKYGKKAAAAAATAAAVAGIGKHQHHHHHHGHVHDGHHHHHVHMHD